MGCGIIYIDKLGRGVLPERVAGYADNLRRAKPEPSRGIKVNMVNAAVCMRDKFVAGISVDVGRRIHARCSPDGATATA